MKRCLALWAKRRLGMHLFGACMAKMLPSLIDSNCMDSALSMWRGPIKQPASSKVRPTMPHVIKLMVRKGALA